MKRIIYCLLVSIIFVYACKGKDKDKKNEYAELSKNELTQLNLKYDSALIDADTLQLDRIYADEFKYITPEGQVRNKSAQLDFISSGGLNLEFGKSDEVEISVYDSTAIVTGLFAGKGVFKENIIDVKERYSTVWVKKSGEWKLVLEQGTHIPK